MFGCCCGSSGGFCCCGCGCCFSTTNIFSLSLSLSSPKPLKIFKLNPNIITQENYDGNNNQKENFIFNLYYAADASTFQQ